MRRLIVILLLAPLAFAGCQSRHLPEACDMKPSSGKCRASIMRYWYDEGARTCKGFIWGGCEGSVPFETMESCAAQCMPGQPVPDVPDVKHIAPPSTEGTPP